MSRVAPLSVGWSRRMRVPAGPLSASGVGSSADPVNVEILIDGIWSDITDRVMVRDESGQIGAAYGQTSEGANLDPATCSFLLNNRDGLFSPRNPLGLYYGKIGRNTRLRVYVNDGDDRVYRFWGEVPAWPQHWDTSGVDVWVEVQAAGILRRLSQGTSPLRSVMYRALTSSSLANSPLAYWPCEDAGSATSVASGLGGGEPMVILGEASFGTSTAFVCSAALPEMSSASFMGTVPSYTYTGTWQVRFLLGISQGGAVNGQRVCTMKTSDVSVNQVDVTYGTGGYLTISASGPDGSAGSVGPYSFGLDGELVMVSIAIQDNSGVPASVTFTTSVLVVGSTSPTTFVDSLSPFNLERIKQVSMAPDGVLTNVVVGHVSVHTGVTSLNDLASPLSAYAGETADARFLRLCSEEGVDAELTGTSGDGVAMGGQGQQTLLALLQECADADMGLLYEMRDALGLGYRTRISLENQSAALSLDYSAYQLAQVPVPVDDDQLTRNDWTVSRTGGSSVRQTLSDGALSVNDPPAGIGVYDDSVTVNIASDADLLSQAGWRLHVTTVDEARFPSMAVNLAHVTFTSDAVLRSQVLSVARGDRLVVSGMPSWTGPDDVSVLVVGTSETLTRFAHVVDFACVPESPYHVAVVEDGSYGRVDTDGCGLTAAITAVDGVVGVTTVGAYPTWTTDVTDTPFDVRVGGEVMSVYAVGQVLNANSEFVSDVSGWTAFGGGSIAWSSAQAKFGAGSCLLTANGGANPRFEDASVGVTVGASYRAVGWLFAAADVSGAGGMGVNVNWYDGGFGYLSTSSNVAAAPSVGVWTLFDTTFTAPASAAYAGIVASIPGTPSAGVQVYGDGIRLIPVSSYNSNPQSLMVTRSVNGIVRAHDAGVDVRLDKPAIVGL